MQNNGYDAKTEATSGDDVAADGWNDIPAVSSANATDVHVTDALGLSAVINSMRESISSQLPEFIIYNLPGALWAAAYILTTEYFLYRQSVKTRILVAGIIPVIGAVSELLQLTGLLPGTFDVADLLCYLVPYLLYMSITLKIKRI